MIVETPDGQAVLSGFVDRVDTLDTPDGGYFRVIDYKTGHKEFDYTDLLCGQGLQMLLYLFAIERSKGSHEAAGRKPAGVLYVPGRVDVVSLEPGARGDGAFKKAAEGPCAAGTFAAGRGRFAGDGARGQAGLFAV